MESGILSTCRLSRSVDGTRSPKAEALFQRVTRHTRRLQFFQGDKHASDAKAHRQQRHDRNVMGNTRASGERRNQYADSYCRRRRRASAQGVLTILA